MQSALFRTHRVSSRRILTLALALSVLLHLVLLLTGGMNWVKSFHAPPPPPLMVRIETFVQVAPPPSPPPPPPERETGRTTTTGSPPAARPAHKTTIPPVRGTARHTVMLPDRAYSADHPAAPALSMANLLSQAGTYAEQTDLANTPPPGRLVYGITARGAGWSQYIDDWVNKMERIGALNFPEEVRRQGLTGGPTLSVIIRADGSLESLRIIGKSTSPLLDAAADKLVRSAAPFAAFPPELARQARSIEIRRKWTFTTDDDLTVK
jgi:protein TonB